MKNHKSDLVTVDILTSIAFLNDAAMIANMKNELPRYLARANGIADGIDPIRWWKENEAELPFWSAAAKLILLMQPSSALSERVFAILTTAFGHLQDLALEDYIECSLMLQFNQCRSRGNITGGARERQRREPLGRSGGMLPQKILKARGLEMLFPAFSKSDMSFMHIANYLLRTLSQQTNVHWEYNTCNVNY